VESRTAPRPAIPSDLPRSKAPSKYPTTNRNRRVLRRRQVFRRHGEVRAKAPIRPPLLMFPVDGVTLRRRESGRSRASFGSFRLHNGSDNIASNPVFNCRPKARPAQIPLHPFLLSLLLRLIEVPDRDPCPALLLAACLHQIRLKFAHQLLDIGMTDPQPPGHSAARPLFRSARSIPTGEPLPHQPPDYLSLPIAPQGPRPPPYRARFGEVFS